jgi:penicillin amidase
MLRPDLEAAGGPTAERLMSWDGRMDASSGGAPTYERLMLSLATAVGGDEASLEGLGASPIGPEELVRLLAGGIDEKWWDDVGLPGVQTRMDVISGVLGDLDTGGGRERWGDDHTVAFDHPLTLAPGIGWLLADSWNRGPFAIGGGNVTVNAQYWNRNAPFAVTTIPAARFVADVGAWDKTLLVLPIGQSGRPWSAHYADQIAPWIGVEGRVFPFTRDAVDAAAVARWEMVPDGPGQRLPQEAE